MSDQLVCGNISEEPINPQYAGCIVGWSANAEMKISGEENSATNEDTLGDCACNIYFLEWPGGDSCECTSCGCYVDSITVSDVTPANDCKKGYWGVNGKVTTELKLPSDSQLWSTCYVGVLVELFSDEDHTDMIGMSSVNCQVTKGNVSADGYFHARLDQEMPGQTVYVKVTASDNMINTNWPQIASKWIDPDDPRG